MNTAAVIIGLTAEATPEEIRQEMDRRSTAMTDDLLGRPHYSPKGLVK